MNDPQSTAADTSTAATLPWRMIALFVLTAVCIVLSLLFTRELLFSVVCAVALAVVTQPLTLRFEKCLSPALTATALVLLVALALLVPLYFILRDLVGEAVSLVQFVQNGSAEQSLTRIAQNHPKLGGYLQHAAQQADLPGIARRVAGSAARPIAIFFSQVASGLTSAVLLLFFYFFLVRDHRQARDTLASFIPLPPADTHDLLHQTGEVVQAIFAGRFVIAAIQGALAGIAYLLLGVPGALLWGSLTVICCLVPAFGSFVAWVPIALYLGLSQSWLKAAILAAWGGIFVGNIDNVLYPMLVGKRTDLHTAVIFVAIFGGVAVFGISGFILGPVIISVSLFLLKFWKRWSANASHTA